jgi:hypothetical protein
MKSSSVEVLMDESAENFAGAGSVFQYVQQAHRMD